MQIHELTKRRKTNEGLLDNIKSAVSAAKTGYAAGKAGTGSTLGAAGTALGTFGKAITSPGFAAQSDKDANKDAAMKKYNDLKDKYGWSDKPAAGTAPAGQAAATPGGQAEVAKVTKEITSTPQFADLSQVLPDPSHLLKVTLNGGNYYKDENGVWKNADGEAIKGTPGETGYGKAFDKIIDADQYTQVDLKSVPFGTKDAAGKPMKEARNPMAQRSAASVVKSIIQAKNKELAKKLSDPAIQPAVQAASAKLDTIAQTRGEAAKSKKKKMISAATAMAKALVGAGQTAAPGTQAGQDQQAQAQPDQAQGVKANDPVAQSVAANKLAMQGIDKPTIDKFKQQAQKDPAGVKQALGLPESRKPLTQRLEEALQLLKEDQVYITKDIRIRTPKGDYVKRVSDQNWYDPNGVMIDPTKYADYIKKLDATPMAQTQYQADSQKAAKGKGPGGTDAGAQQAAQQAAQTPPPPPPQQPPAAAAAPQEDPMDQMLKQQKMQQWLRGQNVDSLNAQIKDTTNQLRNAQIFGTGQTEYLQQQLAQLIAMKV
jgi:hypothetical protein